MEQKSGSTKNRNANFSASEKQLLFSLVSKYKNIIENKKTDGTSNEAKLKAWLQVEKEFNAACPDGRRRNMYSLRKLYSNKKKEVRKLVAEERKERYKTGGGSDTEDKFNTPDKELILSLVNSKTMYGIPNAWDCDAEEQPLQNKEAEESSTMQNKLLQATMMDVGEDTVEVLYEAEECNEDNSNLMVSKKLLVTPQQKVNPVPQSTASLLQTPLSSSLRSATGAFHSSSRRRPATTIRALTSSAVAEKYSELLQQRIEITQLEKRHWEQNEKRQQELHQLQKQSLLLDIEIKKKKLNNL